MSKKTLKAQLKGVKSLLENSLPLFQKILNKIPVSERQRLLSETDFQLLKKIEYLYEARIL